MTRNNNSDFKLWKVALYIRLSKEDGNNVSYSVINQKSQLNEFIQNCEEEFELVDYYIDDGFTGTDSNRNSFQRMFADIESNKVDCVIVKDLSRLSRNYIEAGQYLEYYFVQKNIRFISLELPQIDSYKHPESMNSIMVPIQSVFNDNFARETSIKVRKTFDTKRNKGEFIGAFAPYGYKKDPNNKNKLIVDEAVKNNIINIFRMFISGKSKMGIARELNNLGVLCPTAYKEAIGLNYKNPNSSFKSLYWNIRTVDSILKNQVYIGNMVQGRNKIVSYKIHKQIQTPQSSWFIVEDTHEPIIDHNTFNKAQELLKKEVKSSRTTKEAHLFAGLLRCKDCNRAMRRKKSGQYIYYVCRTYNDLDKSACTNHSISEKNLIEGILDTLNTQFTIIEEIETMISNIDNSEIINNELSIMNGTLELKKQEYQKINQIRDDLYSDWKKEIITKEDFFRLREKFDEQANLIKQDLEQLKKKALELKTDVNPINSLFEYYKKYKGIDHLERSIILELIECIYIDDNGKIEIDFKFTDQIKHILKMLEAKGEKLRRKFAL